MKQTILTLVMAALCLSFSYSQTQLKCSSHTGKKCPDPCRMKTFQYGITGFKPAYKPGVKITEDKFNRGKMILVRNHSIIGLFAIAMGAGTVICDQQILLEVKDPKKLCRLHCYKLVVPTWQRDNFYTIMQQNLNAEFPQYLVAMELRNGKYFMVIKDRDDKL